MYITDQASAFLANMLAEEGKNCLTFELVGYGCHSQLSIDFINEDHPAFQINGLNVSIDDETFAALDGITIDYVNDSLVFRSDCSNGCQGCHGGCHETCESDCCSADDDQHGCCCQ